LHCIALHCVIISLPQDVHDAGSPDWGGYHLMMQMQEMYKDTEHSIVRDGAEKSKK
jgi:hypothetical protein